VPADCRNGAVFAGGKTVAELTGTTFTMLPDFMAENHGIVHPTYTASGILLAAETAVLHGLLGRPAPPHLFRNRPAIYRNLKRQSDRHGFPHPVQGMDWPYVNAHTAMTHGLAGLYLDDPDGVLLETRALDFLERMVADNGGRLVRRDVAERYSSIQDPMIMNESYAGQFAWGYLAHRLRPRGLPRPPTPEEFDRRNRGVSIHPHAGFAFHRHARGATSFSWRNTTMALPLDADGILRIAPMAGTLLGSVAVKSRPASSAARTLRVAEEPDSFAVLFVEDLAQETVRRRVIFASLPDGSCLSWERFTALSDCTVERSEQGSFEVMNESFPLAGRPAGGYRELRWPGNRRRVEARLDPRPGGDETIPLPAPAWLNIDDRIGIVYAGTGRARYVNRRFFRPYHAVCDLLVLSDGGRPRSVRAGAAIAEMSLLFSPGERARTTAARRLAHNAGGATAALCCGPALLAGNFAGRPAAASLSISREASPDTYAGALLRIAPDSLRYDVPLGPFGLRLCRRAERVETEASGLAIEITGTGAIAAANTGRRRAAFAVGTGRNRRSFALGPSETAVIPPPNRTEAP